MKYKELVLTALLATSQAYAQEPAGDAEAPQVVAVNGVRNPELKPYKQMVKGIDAYEAHRSLAPKAPLKFMLLSQGAQLDYSTVTLRIVGDNTQVPLELGADGVFLLPRLQSAVDDNAEIVANKPKGLLRWRANIQSPDVPAGARRLGDMRLECEIGWAIQRDDMSFFTRNGLAALGGLCNAKMVGLRYQAPKPLAAVSLVSGERKTELSIDPQDKRVFWPPLADKSWDNDTLVVYTFAPEAN
jgi:hypothetical protein